MYCTKCGNKLRKTDKFCEKCGNNLNPQITNNNKTDPLNNKILFGAMGFLWPVAGLVLYIAEKDHEPELAKMAGLFALIRLPINFFIFIFYIFFILLSI